MENIDSLRFKPLNLFQKKLIIQNASPLNIIDIRHNSKNIPLSLYTIFYESNGVIFTHSIVSGCLTPSKILSIYDIVDNIKDRLNEDLITLNNIFFNDEYFSSHSNRNQSRELFDAVNYILCGYYNAGLLATDPDEDCETMEEMIEALLFKDWKPLKILLHYLSINELVKENVVEILAKTEF